MKGMRRWKNLAIAAVLGLVIGVQSVVPVQAEEAVPIGLVRCPKCSTALNVNLTNIKSTGKREGPFDCTREDHHLTNCSIYKVEYTAMEQHVCPACNYSKDITWTSYWTEQHISTVR